LKELLDRFEWQVQTNPEHTAIIDGSQIITYSALAGWTDAVAIQISAQGLDPTKPIAYLGSQGINLIVAFLACQKAGYTFLPIDRNTPPKIIAQFLAVSNSSMCVTDQDTMPKDWLAPVETLFLMPQPSDQIPIFQRASVDERAVALLHCSSGSTSAPKIIPHSRMALQGYSYTHRNEYKLKQKDVVAHMDNFWLESVLATFAVGATLSCFDPWRNGLGKIIERMSVEKVSVLPLYPALLRAFHGTDACLTALRLIMVSGEEITKLDVKIFESITLPRTVLLNCYASQEAIWVTSYRHQNGDPIQLQTLPVGKPVSQIEVQILSNDGTSLPVGEIGEIVIKSHLLPSNYLGELGESTKQFHKDENSITVYETQDMGYLDSVGNLHFVSRKNDVFKIRGFLVDIKEVERILANLPEFIEVAVSVSIGPNNKNQLICYYVSAEPVIIGSIIKLLQTQLAGFMIPHYFHRLNKLPKTPSGKISRRHLQSITPTHKNNISMQTETQNEKVIAKLMAEILGHSNFNKYDEFFDIGGDSLAAMNLILKMETKFGFKYPTEDLLLEGSSVEHIANRIASHTKNTDTISLVPLNYASTDRVFYALPVLQGHLSDYVVLGEAMSTSAKIMGIRFNSLFLSVRRKPLSLKKLATEAANKIIEQKSSGKINLIGYSAAGLLAYETAKALQEHGHEINSLILIDSDPTFKKLKWPILLILFAGIARSISRKIRRKENWANRRTYSHLQLQNQLVDQCITPIAVNRPILFVAQLGSLNDAQIERWQTMVSNNLEVVPIAGGHHGLRQMDIAMDIAQKVLKK